MITTGTGEIRALAYLYTRIQDSWYSYRNNALKRIATDFLEGDGITFVDDTGVS
jgi:hypothetical protein